MEVKQSILYTGQFIVEHRAAQERTKAVARLAAPPALPWILFFGLIFGPMYL